MSSAPWESVKSEEEAEDDREGSRGTRKTEKPDNRGRSFNSRHRPTTISSKGKKPPQSNRTTP